jgi:hypothetical protein
MIKAQNTKKKTDRRKKTYLNPCYNTGDIYKFYKELVEKKDIKYQVSLQEFKMICHEYNKTIADLILNHSQIVKIPHRLGEIGIRKRKMNFDYLKLDFGHLRKTGEKRYHSGEWVAKWHWSKKNCMVVNKRLYSFTTTDSNKKALAKIMLEPDGHKKFFEA